MYIGHSFYIYFNVFNDVNSTRTWMFLDDVRLIVCYATAAVTATATPTAMPVLGATVTPTPPALGSTATLTTTGDVAIAAQAMSTPGNGELSSGFSSPLASDMLGEARTSDPVAPASTSPLWTAFLVWVSGNRIPIFVTLLVFVLVAIFALRR
ncbi:MAG: hypothetical protein DWI57_15110 [Chloroflexi bacterium]|nr:MAG: hypothetical protein DWI57_15110 [Chloroflexota bacterium]